jgi:hypothetical protein
MTTLPPVLIAAGAALIGLLIGYLIGLTDGTRSPE